MSRNVSTVFAAILAVAALGAMPVGADSIATTVAYVPIVNIKGDTGVFQTDVWIFSPETTLDNEVDLYFTRAGEDGTTSYIGVRIDPPLAPRESVSMPDILKTIFGQTGTYGLLEVRATYPVMVTSNTYNTAGSLPGTYGQYSPGQPDRNALGFDDSVYGDLYVTGLTNEDHLRTNAVVMNPSEVPLQAGVALVDAMGMIYGTRFVDVPPLSLTQLNDVFGREFAAYQPPKGGPYRLTMFVNVGNGARILGYATVMDKRTGDPYLITAQAMRP